jgi:two-component SAPR family response regulator
MDKQAVKDLMFGGINELMRNRQYYHHSSVGQAYSYWTDEGKEALQEYMQVMGWKLKEAEEADLKKRAKEMTMTALKGETV